MIIGLVLILLIGAGAVGYYVFRQYWIHRYDELIFRQATVYRLDDRLVWSVIYEETYFRAWMVGADAEVGLMQITPTVAREWAKETGLKEFEKQSAENVNLLLRDPERNIQIGCWYLEKLRERYHDYAAENAMTLAAYNAGPSRVEEWTRGAPDASRLKEEEFVRLIGIASTRSYVTSILERFYEQKR
ncbi:MAG: lytic transglycosylase domain-containing protein [Acidobacteria bacterium]|nr:lytic transglycosylase domain-containing protein [Acidobacteriota bacterium]MBK8810010.1 lytic transglycosylase domain-containing protein [Acidobacteriota bacterium]